VKRNRNPNKKKLIPKDPSQVAATVQTWENIAQFLRALSTEIAVVPTFSAEITKACVIVSSFLEDRARTARSQYPDEFKTEETK
jgi:hypothetical protein